MIKCLACGSANSENAAYCFKCGTPLIRTSDIPEPKWTKARATSPIRNIAMNRTLTGIEGLDAMIGGGVPKGRVVLVCGGPGTGKTTMSLQFLVNGFMKFGENGLFISLDEPMNKLLEDTSGLDWNLKELIDNGKIGIIETPTLNGGKFSVEELFEKIRDAAGKLHAQRIALDPLTYVSIHYPDIVARRRVILSLFGALTATGATCLVTNEIRGEFEKVILLEEYLADGVLRLQSSQIDRGRVRTLEVDKMRGTIIDDQIRPYTIENSGLRVISDRDVFSYAASILSKQIVKEKTVDT